MALSRSTKGVCRRLFTRNTRFAFGHGGDHSSYVGLILKPFHFPSRLLPRDLGTTSINLSHVRIGYAETAVWAGDNCNVTLSDSQLINCQTIAVLGTGDGQGYPQALTCNNCLYIGPYYGALVFDYGFHGDSYNLTNCTFDHLYFSDRRRRF